MSVATNPGVYPGNSSLPREVQEKILSTFRHTLNLFGQGKLDDCLIGCDFILKMDPRFNPARSLMDKARNPNADVDIAQLEALVATTPTRQERMVAVEPERLLVRAVESYNARDFEAAIAAAEQVLAVLPGNQDALEILQKATSKKAAQPLFNASRQRAIAALEANRTEDVRRELETMRHLDPDHPAVALLERRIGGAPAPPAATAPSPGLDSLSLDLGGPEPSGLHTQFGTEMREPEIAFDHGPTRTTESPPPPLSPYSAPPPEPGVNGGLESLNLESLSLDTPDTSASVAPPSPGPATPAPSLLASAPPGSPADLWGEGPGNLELTEPPPPQPPAALPPLESIEEEEPQSGEREIAALLKQGDEAAKRGDRQQAIEIWSRIFLIDINNSDAVSRIEKARQEMAEGNRVISDCLKTGREKFEAGDLAAARELFLQVLAVDENEPTARFYIDRIEEELAHPSPGGPQLPGKGAAASEAAATPIAPMPIAARAPRAAPRSIRLPVPPKALALISAFLFLTVVGVYFFVIRGAKTQTPEPKLQVAGSLAHAQELLASAKIAQARTELARIPRGHADYAEAQKILAELGQQTAESPPGTASQFQPPGGVAPPPPPFENEPARLRTVAEKALAEKRYIEALKNFNLAAPGFRNDPTFAQAIGLASEKVTALTPAVKLYNEREYETAIPLLWRMYQEDHENQDARSYLLRAYYNQGIAHLQNGLYQKAMQSFSEALALDPNDLELVRHRKFAERYQKGDLDLMGRIYVRHLSQRP